MPNCVFKSPKWGLSFMKWTPDGQNENDTVELKQ